MADAVTTAPGKPAPAPQPDAKPETPPAATKPAPPGKPMPKEVGGPEGPEPTRYGDWQFKGRVTDF